MAQKHMKKMLTISSYKGNANQNIKTILRFHLIPFRIAIIKNTNNMCWQGCGGEGTLIHCWWECNWCNHSGNKSKHRSAILSSNPIPGDLPEGL
jgi:hypothetical protein